ncbi:MAG TPA: tRNA glutamyl-Q(34) synthetase GluQRS [Piscinibacter sp.]|nr:tRNA glutamyl-Q(34) synthetase GluQRS [Piscinibacter sp.]
MSAAGYVGRFAPSPTGPLHAGSLVAALASWLDARAHGGRWLLRIEDVDSPRCVPGADRLIIEQLAACGLQADEAPLWQSARGAAYQQALDRLIAAGWAYPCGCTRRDIELALRSRGTPKPRGAELVYPGTCREGLHGRTARAVRMRTSLGAPAEEAEIEWHDRRLGTQRQRLCDAVGDFVLKRADGLWAYQLAVVVDDAAQGITHVVRGEDLADNTPRQILLQRALGLRTPSYLHTPLVLGADGEKLSKQNGATALDLRDPLAAVQEAARVLGLAVDANDLGGFLAGAVNAWRRTLA